MLERLILFLFSKMSFWRDCIYTQTHTHTHTHSPSLSRTRTHAHTLSLSRIHTLNISHTHTHTLSLAPACAHTFSLSHTHTLSLSCIHPLSESLTHAHTHSRSLAHTRTHSLILSRTPTHPHTHTHTLWSGLIALPLRKEADVSSALGQRQWFSFSSIKSQIIVLRQTPPPADIVFTSLIVLFFNEAYGHKTRFLDSHSVSTMPSTSLLVHTLDDHCLLIQFSLFYIAQYHKWLIFLRGLCNLYTYDIPDLWPHIGSGKTPKK